MGQCMLNGKPVGVGQGACNAGGGTWIPDDSDVQSDRWRDKSFGSKARDVATYGSLAIPVGLGWNVALRGGKLAYQGIKNADKLKKLMAWGGGKLSGTGKKLKKIFPGAQGVKGHRAYTDPRYLFTRPNIKSSYPINPFSPRMRQFSPMRTLGTTIGAGQIGGGMYNAGMIPGTDPRTMKLAKREQAQIGKMEAFQASEDAKAKTISDAKAETERVEGLNFWERMGEEGYWDKSFSGNPNDTRLTRLTDLVGDMAMSKTEYNEAKRAGVTAEQKWRDTEQAQAEMLVDLQNAQTAANAKSRYGKMTPGDLTEGIKEIVKTRFQGLWPGMKEEDLTTYTWLVAQAIINISNSPEGAHLGEHEAVEAALSYVEENFNI